MIHHHHSGHVFSIDRVRSEILLGREEEDLVRWVRNEVPRGFFRPVDKEPVVQGYTEIMMWVQRHSRYADEAKAKFATGADGWLVAYARVHGATVVTNERSARDAVRVVKLPDVCDQFHARHENTFSMLRALNISFDWSEAARRRSHPRASSAEEKT